MSVLVKGMKKPKACFWRDKNGSLTICPLCDADGYCGANGKQRCLVPENEVPNDCPLIELPPHGDLIDRNDLRYSDFDLASIALDKGNPYKNLARDILARIESAPTILEAEEGE